MADTKKIKVIIDGDSSRLQQATKKGSKSLTNMSKVGVKLGGILASTFAASAVINFTKAAVKAFDTQAKAEAKLLTALKGRRGVQQNLIAQARELQGITLFGDEQTIEAQAFLATMGLSEDAIMRLTPLVQDLATKMGGDLKSAADLIAKSVGSSTNALSRYGITIEGAVGSGERLESAIEQLNKQVGGQSVAAAEAGAGAYVQLGNAWGDLMETFGGGLVGESGGVIKFLKEAVELTNALAESGNLLLFAINPTAAAMAVASREAENVSKANEDAATVTAFMGEAVKLTTEQIQGLVTQFKEAGNQTLLLEPLTALLNERIKEETEAARLATEQWIKYNEAKKGAIEADTIQAESYSGAIPLLNELSISTGNLADRIKKTSIVTQGQTESYEKNKDSALEAGLAAGVMAAANRDSAKDVIAAALAASIANFIKSASFLPAPFNVAAAIGAAALVKGLFDQIPSFATGTSFAPGGMSLVGERGPELVNLPRGASVTPNHLSGGSGGTSIVVNGFVGNEFQLARQIEMVLRNQSNTVSRTI